MALQFIRAAQQLKILDAADEAVAVVRSRGFNPHRPAFEAVKFDLTRFADQLDRMTTNARTAYTARASGQASFEAESSEAREAVAAFEGWVRRLHAAARAISKSDHPVASKVEDLFRVGVFEGGSAENVFGNGPQLVADVASLGDLTDVGLPPSFVDEGRTMLAAIRSERTDAWDVRTVRVTQTAFLHELLDDIVDHMDRFSRYREFAMAMADAEIPDLGLAVIRASLAGPTKAPLAVGDVATPSAASL